MKTILIVEPIVSELESLMDFCRRGADDIIVLSARQHEQSLSILQQDQVDLILCSTSFQILKIARLSMISLGCTPISH